MSSVSSTTIGGGSYFPVRIPHPPAHSYPELAVLPVEVQGPILKDRGRRQTDGEGGRANDSQSGAYMFSADGHDSGRCQHPYQRAATASTIPANGGLPRQLG